MTAVLYEVEISGVGDRPLDTGIWLDQVLRQVLESEGFESGRVYRGDGAQPTTEAGADSDREQHVAIQFRVRSEAELDNWKASSESGFLEAVRENCGSTVEIVTRRLFAATELATPSDASGAQSVTECPNCGARVTGKFCAACGQDNNVSVVAFHRLVGDFIRDFFNFDSRLFNSIGPLILKPGFLTVEYLAGRRATYLPPVRMTLFLSIIFFGLVALQAGGATQTRTIQTGDKPAAAVPDNRLLRLEVDDDDTIELTSAESGWLKTMEDRATHNFRRLGKDGDYQRDMVQQGIGHLPVMMFLLLPVFAFILKILHVRSGRYYVEHLILSMHIHAFNFLTLAVIVGLSMIPAVRAASLSLPGWLITLWWLWFLLYPWLAMKRVYRQGVFKTTVKFGFSSLVYFVLLGLGMLLTALVSLSL